MANLGRHVLLELYDCDPEKLGDAGSVRHSLMGAAAMAGAHIVTELFHQFAPQGVSGVVVIQESHLAIHTWPEKGYAAVDVFTCGTEMDPSLCIAPILEAFGARRHMVVEIGRGAGLG
jgi:spermidine synthase